MKLQTKQHFDAWGRSGFGSFSASFCPEPELRDVCSGLEIGEVGAIVSIGDGFASGNVPPLFIYKGEPCVIMSLDACSAYVGVQPSLNLLQFMPQQEEAIPKLFGGFDKETTDLLVETLCIMWDFSEAEAPELFEKKSQMVRKLLSEVDARYEAVDVAKLEADIRAQPRHLYAFEEIMLALFSEYQKTHNKALVQQALYLPFLNRFGAQPGAVMCLEPGMPVFLGAGEYFAFQPRFINELRAAYQNKEPLLSTDLSFGLITAVGFVGKHAQMELTREGFELKAGDRVLKRVQFAAANGQVLKAQDCDFVQFVGQCELGDAKQVVPCYMRLSGQDALYVTLTPGMMPNQIAYLLVQSEAQ